MTFNSYIFIFCFLPISVIGYHLLNKYGKYTAGLCFLLTASLFFYGYFNYSYLMIITISVIVNYLIYLVLTKKQKHRKLFLVAGIVFNLGTLGYYKYYDFFVQNLNNIFGIDIPFKHILLPLGISFFTFQQISFVVDVYKSEKKVAYSFIEYACYVTFFPQLVAGPIVTHDVLIPQLRDVNRKKYDGNSFSKGLFLFVLGLGKKVLLADTFGGLVDMGYSDVTSLSMVTATLVILGYAFQIYFDFSGYSDMAIGLGWMMNIDLPVNFESPYKALSVTEFWKRWHITLTDFFRRYIYLPLGGSRKGNLRTYINIFLIFILSGFWHGAGWNYIFWGGIHGVMQIIEKIGEKRRKETSNSVLRWVISFGMICLSWVFFRAESIQEGIDLIKKVFGCQIEAIDTAFASVFWLPEWKALFSINWLENHPNILAIAYYLLAFVIVLGLPNARKITEKLYRRKMTAIIISIIFVWCVLSLTGKTTFLYFNF